MRSRLFKYFWAPLGIALTFGFLFGSIVAGRALVALAVEPGIPPGYAIYQTVALDSRESGISGFLQILQDERVTAMYRDGWGSTNDPAMVLDEHDPLLKSIELTPMRMG